MRPDEAMELLRAAVPVEPGRWGDLGAGEGVFTLALAGLLPPGSRIVAVDRDERALEALRRAAGGAAGVEIVAVAGDLQEPGGIPELAEAPLRGVLFANALHFTPHADRVLARVAPMLEDAGRVVVVEYDGRPASRWVPHPLPLDGLRAIAAGAGFRPPRVVGTRPSAYGGVMYCAVLER